MESSQKLSKSTNNASLGGKQKVKWVNPLKDRTRVIPFVVPNHQARMNALGSLAGQNWRIKRSLQAILQDFQPIKTPQPGDNLFEYEEDGQDFPLFSSIYRNHIDKESQVIYISAFKCNLSKEIIKSIRKRAKAFFYGVKVKVFELPQNIELKQFDERISQTGEKYYDGAKLNTYFAKVIPKNVFSIAIITSLLIYNGDRVQTELKDLWVFGLGSIKDRTSIISYEQILKKGYDSPKQQSNAQKDQFNIDMLGKVVNHQLCHTFALKHCIFFTCLMNGSNGYHQASTKEDHLCPICLRKLQQQLKFDIAERFQDLGDDKSKVLAQKIKKTLTTIKKN